MLGIPSGDLSEKTIAFTQHVRSSFAAAVELDRRTWFIVNGIKDIENRSWRTRYRGPLLIQASARKPSQREMEDFRVFARKRRVKLPDKFEFGGIVGRVQLDDCVDKSRSKWFEGSIGWVVSKPKKLPFIPLKGRLGLFDPPPRVLKKLGLTK